jgi:uncharacterized membrane protein
MTIWAIKSENPPLWDTFRDVRLYVFVAVFVGLGMLTPWIFHRVHLAGPTFLPMHFFVLVGGLLFGWRVGVLAGLLTPAVSFVVSGMPVPLLLPQITSELAMYGLVSGLLRERTGIGTVGVLLSAMIAGRLALGMAVLVADGGAGDPISHVWGVVALGYPGMIMQLLLIPPVVHLLGRRLGPRISS